MSAERERLVRAVEEANATAMRCRIRYGRISEELAQIAIDAQSALTKYDNALEQRDYLWSKRQCLAQNGRRANEAEQRTVSAKRALAAYDAAHPGEAK